jgi:hypothetical protein
MRWFPNYPAVRFRAFVAAQHYRGPMEIVPRLCLSTTWFSFQVDINAQSSRFFKIFKNINNFLFKVGGCMPLFFTFLFIFNTIHYLTHHIFHMMWLAFTILFTPHTVAVMRLVQAGFMRGSGGVF